MTYSIVRNKDGTSTKIPADEGTLVQPGDVVKVEPIAVTQ